MHDFCSVALETLCPMSAHAQKILMQMERLTDATTQPQENSFLFQYLSVAIKNLPRSCLAHMFQMGFYQY